MLKKSKISITVSIIILLLMASYNQKVMARNLLNFNEQPIKVAVFLASFDEPYVADIKKSMEEVEKENAGKVKYEFYDGKRDQRVQNNDISAVLEKQEVQLILVNLVKQGEVKYAVDRIKEYNIPVVFFGGTDINKIKAYNKAYWIGTDPTKGGVLQGEVIVSLWNNKKDTMDKNKDNNMQYIMLKGSVDDVYASERTKYSIIEVNKARIKNQELDSVVCSWSSEEAYNATKNSLLKFGNNIEMIIANNDSMAIGAIKALLELGYNKGDERMTIPVVGFDGIIEAQELIKKNVMSGTVIQNPNEFAKAFYTVGMNIVNNRQPLEGTEYKTDADGISIIIPYQGIMISFN